MKETINKNKVKKIRRKINEWTKGKLPLSKSNEKYLTDMILRYYPDLNSMEQWISDEYVDEYQIKKENFDLYNNGKKVDSIPLDDIVSWFIEKHPLFRSR
jgi:hypothetical protein